MSFTRSCDGEKCVLCLKSITIDQDGCIVTVPSKKLNRFAQKTKDKFKIKWQASKSTNFFHADCWEHTSTSSELNATETRLISEVIDTMEKFSSAGKVHEMVDEVVEIMTAKETKQIVCFTGAGISAAAGIPTYRGADGIDTLQELAGDTTAAYATVSATTSKEIKIKRGAADSTAETVAKKPRQEKKTAVLQAEEEEEDVDYTALSPTFAHYALARLAELDLLHGCATQNCDNLHAKAGLSSQLISDLHGNVFKEYCEKCLTEYERDYSVDIFSTDCMKESYAKKCPQCGWNHYTGRICHSGSCRGKLRDTIVNFGDDLHPMICGGLWKASRKHRHADLCLTLGTSLTVYPASELPLKAKKLVIVNLQATELDDDADVRVWATCDNFFSLLMPKLEAAVEKKLSTKANKQSKRKATTKPAASAAVVLDLTVTEEVAHEA